MVSYELIGLVGGLFSSLSGVPQLIKTIQTKSTESFSWGMLTMTVVGCAISVVYGFLIQHSAIYITSIVALLTYKPILLIKMYYELYVPRKTFQEERSRLIQTTQTIPIMDIEKQIALKIHHKTLLSSNGVNYFSLFINRLFIVNLFYIRRNQYFL